MELRKNVINNIKVCREKMNISQEELSIKIGKEKNFVSKLEDNNINGISLVLIEKIAYVLKTPVKDIIGDD